MTLFPAIAQAAGAPELRAADVRVLLAISDVLDFVEFRHVKLVVVARLAVVSESTASVALRRLSGAGYLEAQASPDRRTREYRLHFSRDPAPAASPLAATPTPAPASHDHA